jgi:hypothetical protein
MCRMNEEQVINLTIELLEKAETREDIQDALRLLPERLLVTLL